MGVRCDFDVDIRKIDNDGNVISTRRVLDHCPNLITDAGMNHLASGGTLLTFLYYLRVGSGNTAPEYTDTALGNELAAVRNSSDYNGPWAWNPSNTKELFVTKTYYFAVGAAQGTVRELGLSASTGISPMFTHALFKDPFDDPTEIPVAADEQLVVTYRVYFSANETDSSVVSNIKGVDTTFTLRPAKLGVSYSNLNPLEQASLGTFVGYIYAIYGPASVIGSTVDSPSGTSSGVDRITPIFDTYVPGSFERTYSVTLGLSQSNLNNIGAFYANPGSYGLFLWQIGISPRINKTNLDTIKFTFKMKLNRA